MQDILPGVAGVSLRNRMLRPDATWAIFRPDDAERNEAIRLISKAKRKRGINWVTAHMAHSGWPLAPGVYVIGLETHENLVPASYSINRRQENRLHDPADPTSTFGRGIPVTADLRFPLPLEPA